MKGFLFVLLLALPAASQVMVMGEASEGFVSLFNGRDLDAWDGDPQLWSIERGVLTGRTSAENPLKANSFLVYQSARFKNFELRLQIRLRNHNSGIQFRSQALPQFAVRGLQADAAEGNWWGSIYEEKGTRGVIVNGWKGKGEMAVKPNDWNDYWIRCENNLIRLTLNGTVTAELKGEPAQEGVIALQLHAGPPMQVEFRNIRLLQLP
ncbi:MAG: DUF1080 domain-containing protein [Bryobacteraceae bacterium]|nr:DUF1080 domain-containing protein [Bryobacteraceae bacterium]